MKEARSTLLYILNEFKNSTLLFSVTSFCMSPQLKILTTPLATGIFDRLMFPEVITWTNDSYMDLKGPLAASFRHVTGQCFKNILKKWLS
jgi:hypothetical protein